MPMRRVILRMNKCGTWDFHSFPRLVELPKVDTHVDGTVSINYVHFFTGQKAIYEGIWQRYKMLTKKLAEMKCFSMHVTFIIIVSVV